MAFRENWAVKVGRVFDTRPRIGGSRGTMWVPRREVQTAIEDAFQRPGVHVCIDGPTGSGKSSLARTYLATESIPHTFVQIVPEMTWADFCRVLISEPSGDEVGVEAEIELGIENSLPKGKFRVALGSKGRPKDNIELVEAMATSWREHDVAKRLADENVALYIDDVEMAPAPLLVSIAALCKLLTQSYTASYAKLMIVGTGNVFRRLYETNPALEERIYEISVGALPHYGDSWDFLRRGFEALNLYHPGNSRFAAEQNQIKSCMKAIYEAADGLPKSLNRLGQDICREAKGRKAVSARDIITVSSGMPEKNLLRYGRMFPQVLDCIANNHVAAQIVTQLYLEGIGRIHDISAIRMALDSRFSDAMVDHAVEELVNVDFLTRTGISGEVIFASQPILAHTLGVVMCNPHRYPAAERLHEKSRQLTFAFPPARKLLESGPVGRADADDGPQPVLDW